MAEKAIERHNNWNDFAGCEDWQIKHPNAPRRLIHDAVDENRFFDYVTDTKDGVDDGWVDDDKYLDWVLDRYTLYMLRTLDSTDGTSAGEEAW